MSDPSQSGTKGDVNSLWRHNDWYDHPLVAFRTTPRSASRKYFLKDEWCIAVDSKWSERGKKDTSITKKETCFQKAAKATAAVASTAASAYAVASCQSKEQKNAKRKKKEFKADKLNLRQVLSVSA